MPLPNKKWSFSVRRCLHNNLLILLMIIGMTLGIALGFGLRTIWHSTEAKKLSYLRFPGELLINMLKMITLPLIVSSLISSLAELDRKSSGKIGLRAMVYYVLTSLFAVILGAILVASIRPGRIITPGSTGDFSAKDINPTNSLLDIIRNAVPSNLVEASFQKKKTITTYIDVHLDVPISIPANSTDGNKTQPDMNTSASAEPVLPPNQMRREVQKVISVSGTNMLGLILFSIVFGSMVSSLGEQGKPMAVFFKSLYLVTLRLVTIIIWYTPVGIIFLIAVSIIETEDPYTTFKQLALYVPTVYIGLVLHGLVILPLLYFIITRRNPYRFLLNMSKAIFTVFGTASSSATLPITMECLIEKNRVDDHVVNFITPLGATVNMDGTALYEVVSVVFIAQRLGISLGFGQIIVVCVTSLAASIGAAGVPGTGIVVMVMVLMSVGLPVEQISLIFTVDWILDRSRGVINIIGDAFGAGIVEQLSKKELSQLSDMEYLPTTGDLVDVVEDTKEDLI